MEVAMERKSLALLAALTVVVASTDAGAQAWPTKTIRTIVPASAGSNTDIIARVVLDQLSARLRQSMVVENRTGAGGAIGAASAAKSEPDGHTILIVSSAHTIIPAFYQ